jgi:hypothetical protein
MELAVFWAGNHRVVFFYSVCNTAWGSSGKSGGRWSKLVKRV